MTTGSIRVFSALLFCCAIALGGIAGAAQFPNKPVRILIAFPPGGSTDTLARMFATVLASKWGQPVLVENRPGANGKIGIGTVANATPDGYTLLLTAGGFVYPPEDGRKLSYDPIKSFAPISVVAGSPHFLFVNPSLPVKTVKEFITLAQAKPGQLNFATPGIGSTQGFVLKAFMVTTKTKMVDVPYSGGGPAIASVVSGETQATFGSGGGGGLSLVQAGKIRALAVTSIARSPLLPDVPTMAEAANLPGYNHVSWFGVLAPAGTPKEITTQIYRDIVEVIKSPDAQRVMANQGLTPMGSTPAEFAKLINDEVHESWGSRYVK